MAINSTVLIEPTEIATAATTYYTSPTGVTTIIDQVTLTNNSGSSVTYSLYLVPSAGTAGAGNILITGTLLPNQTYIVSAAQNHNLAPGDFIAAVAGTASVVVLRVSGRQVT